VGYSRRGNYSLVETVINKDREAEADAEWAACWEPTVRYTEAAYEQKAQQRQAPLEWRLELNLLRAGSSPIRIAFVA
jgi:hypothetical protein